MKSFSFQKKHRLLNRRDFVNLNRTGKRRGTAHFTVMSKQNGLGMNRLGITVSKKIGNAVKRNKVKRLIREYYRLNNHRFSQGYEIVVVAKKGADELIFRNVKEELDDIISDKELRL